jgi:predicted NUDIX family NTP pyrophosphohydrolase
VDVPVKRSAGVLLYRIVDGVVVVLIVHMGGPFWAHKDAAAWSIPKGEYADDEQPLDVARREFAEELGSPVPPGELVDLGEIKQPSGKVITVWALAADFDATTAVSNTFALEWPKGSGTMQEFPEVDRAEWYDVDTARSKLVRGQVGFLDRLVDRIAD